MFQNHYKRRSLKAKIAFWAMLAMAVVVMSGTSLALWVVRGDMRRTASDSQVALADSMAADLDVKIGERRTALMLTAGVLGPLELQNATELNQHFASRPIVQGLFDAIFTTDRRGTIVFDVPMFAGRAGRSIADREYFKEVMATGRTVISQPLAGKATNEPNIVFAAPLRNRAGETTGVLAGIIYLTRPNFLSALSNVRIGRKGYVALLAKGDDPKFVMHAQRERIMTSLPPPSANAHVHKALEGFEGTVEAVNSQGLEALFSYRSLHSVPWVLMTAYPTAEAYEQLHGTQRQIIGLAALLMLFGGMALWLVTRRLLEPLDRLRQAMVDARGHAQPVKVDIQDETRELLEVAQAFNELMQHTQDVSSALKASEHTLRLTTDNLPALINYIDADQRYTFGNAHFARDFDASPESLIGRSVKDLRSDIWEDLRPHLERALAGHEERFEGEKMLRGRNVYYQTTYVPDIGADGRVRGVFAMTLNITHRKLAELRQARSEERVVSILTHAPDAFVSIDSAGCITEWNRQAELTFGWQRDEVLGRTLADVIIPPEMREGHNAGMARFRHTGTGPVVNNRIEVMALHKDGRRIPVELSIAAVKEGEVFAANAFMRDISERKEAEEQLAASEKRLRDITNNLPAHIAYFDRDERCHFANDTALRTQGVLREDLEKHTLRSAVGDESYAQQAASVRAVLGGQRSSMEGVATHKGRDVNFQAHFVPDLGDDGSVRGFYVMTFDITALKRAEKDRAEGEQRLRTIADNLPVLISYIDSDERLQFANETFREWVGMDPQASVGKPILELIGPKLYEQRRMHLRNALAGQRVNFDVDSAVHGVHRHLHNVYVPDVREDGRVVGVYALSSDVTALKQVERQLSELARVDSLTNLPNRRAFDERLREAVGRSRRAERPMALMFLDIDHFKQINDTYGHGVGDGVLKEFAQRLQGCVRLTDTVARYAGDEFVIILEGIKTSDEAAMLARKIGETVRVPFMLEELTLNVTSSVGVAYLENAEVIPADVVAKADAALYEAKRAGRNTYALSRW